MKQPVVPSPETEAPVPDWLLKHINELATRMGLENWIIFVKMAAKPADDAECLGCVQADGECYQATISFVPTIADNLAGHRLIRHEMEHLLHCDIDEWVEMMLEHLAPNKKALKLLKAQYDAVCERYTTLRERGA
jgi:hypothetical protein